MFGTASTRDGERRIRVSEPIVFVSNQRIKEGQLEGYTEHYRQVVALIEASKPGTVAHLAYVSEDGRTASIVHVFPDAESMERHMQGVGDLARRAYDFMQITSIEIYGQPSDATLETMKRVASTGAAFSIKPRPIGGYIRLK
jgi:hypothetical protein